MKYKKVIEVHVNNEQYVIALVPPGSLIGVVYG